MRRLPYVCTVRLFRIIRNHCCFFLSASLLFFVIIYGNFDYSTNIFTMYYVPPVFDEFKCPVKVARSVSPLALPSLNVKSVPVDKCETRVLLFVDNQYSALGQQIRQILNALKVPYRIQVVRRNLPSLASHNTGRYLIIIFENYYRYLNLNKWNRHLLEKYCQDYGASIVGFVPYQLDVFDTSDRSKMFGFPLYLHSSIQMHDIFVTNESQLPHVVRSGISLGSQLSRASNWIGFIPDHPTYKPILFGVGSTPDRIKRNVSIVLLDNGRLDGVRRVLFSGELAKFWPLKLLFLDSIRHLSFEKISLSLTRYLQVDIDDIFVGHEGTKMIKSDVEELLESQQRLRAYVSNFVYNLGFCGYFYGRGNALEKIGDETLIEKAAHFSWFSHYWRHAKPHNQNLSTLISAMDMNLKFSKINGIRVVHSYAVAPHHSGVYPVHDALYNAWKQVWNVQVTSTEEYPHFKPASLRRGFVYKDIMVLPRQTCGLYTHTIYMGQYPGGKGSLDSSIFGGELFYTFVFNPFLIFMTHQANYARDRLAIYTFENVVKFIRCWTNLKLESVSPFVMGEKYFQTYPQELNPVWGNPCRDQRHIAIIESEQICRHFPDGVIVGPQKTGTTALYKFLKLHNSVRVSIPHPTSYEEVQFFCGKNYMNGINWYAKYFQTKKEGEVLIEKSATYFDSELAPLRIKSLMPTAKIVIVLISPLLRAYSWYQHIKAHGSVVAVKSDFMDILKAKEDADAEAWRFRQRCLTPGHYFHHIDRWLSHFPAKQIYIVDGELFIDNPSFVLEGLQDFLELHPSLNYSSHLVYNSNKGYYCFRTETNGTRCLGKSKGRHYGPMSEEARRWLLNYYKSHNAALLQLMNRLGYDPPAWLQKELKEAT